jgi:hypothetical protein
MKKWIALSLLFVLALFITAKLAAQSAQSASRTTSNPDGRFRIIMRDGVRADTFLLDTETGKVWARVAFTNVKGTPDVWVYEDRLDNESQRETWERHQTIAPDSH